MLDSKNLDEIRACLDLLEEQVCALRKTLDLTSIVSDVPEPEESGVLPRTEPQKLPRMCDTSDVAKMLGISRHTVVAKYVKTGRLPYIEVGYQNLSGRERRRYLISDVQKLLKEEIGTCFVHD